MLVTAKLAPFCAGRPEDASEPDTGRSVAIQMSPLELDPPLVLPHAKATTVAAMRTVSPLARTIWLPLVMLLEAMKLRSDASTLAALFPTSEVGARVRRRRVRPHRGGRNRYSDRNY